MADNSPLDEALAMVGDTVGPDTPQNVRQEKPRLPPQITAGMCRFFKDLKSHENPGVKIRIEYKEKDALKAICADIARHFEEKVTPDGFGAQVVTFDRESCLLYKQALDQLLPPETSDIVISVNSGEEQYAPYRRERDLREHREREAEAEAERQRLARLEHERATARLEEAAKRLKAEKAAAAAAELAADMGKRAELKRRLHAWVKACAEAKKAAAESKRRWDAAAERIREKADAKEKAKFEKQERKRAGAVENECNGWENFARYIARCSTEDAWYPPGSPAGVLVSNGITRLLAAVCELRRAERDYAAVDKEHFRAHMEAHTLAVRRREQAMDAFNSLNALANARYESWMATQRNIHYANRLVPVPIHNVLFEAEVAAQRQHAELCMQVARLAESTAVLPPLPPEPEP